MSHFKMLHMRFTNMPVHTDRYNLYLIFQGILGETL